MPRSSATVTDQQGVASFEPGAVWREIGPDDVPGDIDGNERGRGSPTRRPDTRRGHKSTSGPRGVWQKIGYTRRVDLARWVIAPGLAALWEDPPDRW
jgi:hypothetical protein